MIGKLKDLFRGRDGEWVLSFSTLADPREMFDRLKDDNIDVEIKKHRPKRSLNANNFAWALIDKIAAETHRKKTDIYLEEIRDIGGISTHVGVKEEFVDSYIDSFLRWHVGREAHVVPSKSEKPGWKVVYVRLGSSDFDTSQMHTLISNLIQDAEALGIPTISPEEEQKMIGNWAKDRER